MSVKDGLKRAALVTFISLLLALGLSSVQWLLTLELSGLSNRAGGLSFEDALKWSLEPKALATLLVPNWIMDPTESRYWVLGFRNTGLPYILSIYPGISAVVLIAASSLAALASGAWKRGGAWRLPAVFGAGAIVFLVLSLGREGGLYRLFYEVLPGFDRFRIPERCLFGFAVFFCLALGLGLDFIRRRWEGWESLLGEGKLGGSRAFPAILLAAGCLAAVVFALLLSREPAEPIGPDQYYEYHLGLLWRSLWRSLLFVAACLALAGAAFLRPGLKVWGPWIFCALLFIDLFSAHRHVAPVTSPSFYGLDGHLASSLPEGGAGSRVLVAQPEDMADRTVGAGREFLGFYLKQRLGLQAFTGLELGIREVGAKSSFYPADVDLWLSLLPREQLRLLARGGVDWALRPGYRAIAVPESLPRAYVVPEARWHSDRDSVLAALGDGGFDPRLLVLLEGEDRAGPPRAGNIFWPMKIVEESNHRVEIAVEPEHPGYLVFLDSFYPGWIARLNGREVEVFRANGFFRAIEVGEDGGKVEFIYRPRRFYAGLLVSLFTMAACATSLLGRRASKGVSADSRSLGPATGAPVMVGWAGLVLILVFLPMLKGGTTFVPVAAQRMAVAAMAAAWALGLALRGGSLFRTRLDPWIVGFWLVASLSILRSEYFYISFYWCLQVFTYILLFYFTVQFTAGSGEAAVKRATGVMVILVAAGAIESAWAAGEMFHAVGAAYAGKPPVGFRPSAGYFNPSILAGSLMAICPYVLAKALEPPRRDQDVDGRRVVLWGGLFVLFVAGIFATQARSALLLVVPLALVGLPGLAGIFIARGLAARRAWTRSGAVIGGVATAGVLAVLLFPSTMRDRLLNLGQDPYAFERINIWSSGLEMAADNPLGVGAGMFKYHAHKYRFAVEGVMAARYEKHADTAHNEFIHLAAEMSVLAPALLLAAFFLLGLRVWRLFKEGHPDIKIVGLAAGLVAISLHALIDSNLHNPSIAALVAVLAAVLVAETGRSGSGVTVELAASGAGKWLIAGVMLLVFLAGVPGYAYLGWSYGRTMRGMEESDPARSALSLSSSARHALGNATHYKALAGSYYNVYRQTRNVKILERAIKAADYGIELNPADPLTHRLRGQYLLSLYMVTGEDAFLSGSRRSFHDAYDRSPFDVDVCIGRAWVSRFAKDYEDEIIWWTRALELEPHDLMSRVYLANTLLDLGRTEDAKAQWREFINKRRQVLERLESHPEAFASIYRSKRVMIDEVDVNALAAKMKKALAPPEPKSVPGPEPELWEGDTSANRPNQDKGSDR